MSIDYDFVMVYRVDKNTKTKEPIGGKIRVFSDKCARVINDKIGIMFPKNKDYIWMNSFAATAFDKLINANMLPKYIRGTYGFEIGGKNE